METVRLPNVMTNQHSPHLPPPLSLAAPPELVAATRLEFRRQALEVLEHAVAIRAAMVIVDLSGTNEIDASGLGILVLLQKRAREHGIATCLARATEPVRRLLILTRLDYLFEFEH